jgi:hypothetical protein
MRALLTTNLILAIATLASFGPEARAQMILLAQAEGRPQLAAARASAVQRLSADIQAEAITPSLSVGQLLQKSNSQPRLVEFIRQQSQQIGGPRWLDAQTCQMRLDIPATAVRRELLRIAAENAGSAPVSPDEIARDLRAWDARAFSATGTSTAAIEALRPPPGLASWRDVPQADIRRAVQAARQDAVTHELDSIASVPLVGGKRIGDALAIPQIGDAMANWVGNRPITLVEFKDDRTVDLTLAISAPEISEKLRSILGPRLDVPHPYDDKGWAVITEAIARQMASPTGKGSLAAATQAEMIALPAAAPDWVDHQLDVEATGTAQGRLKAARAAEDFAGQKLRAQIDNLSIGDGRTLGEAARRNPRLSAAIDRAIAREARVYKIDYQSDDRASVRMSLDLNRLWETIDVAR